MNNMYCEVGKKPLAIRFTAMVLLVCIISVTMLSFAFILTHANHHHDHNGPNGTCAACSQIATVENSFKQASIVLVAAIIAVTGSPALGFVRKIIVFIPVFFTLVQLKVRLNN